MPEDQIPAIPLELRQTMIAQAALMGIHPSAMGIGGPGHNGGGQMGGGMMQGGMQGGMQGMQGGMGQMQMGPGGMMHPDMMNMGGGMMGMHPQMGGMGMNGMNGPGMGNMNGMGHGGMGMNMNPNVPMGNMGGGPPTGPMGMGGMNMGNGMGQVGMNGTPDSMIAMMQPQLTGGMGGGSQIGDESHTPMPTMPMEHAGSVQPGGSTPAPMINDGSPVRPFHPILRC